MSTPPVPSLVVFCVDLPQVTAFYIALARMDLAFADAQHVVLRIAGFELVLHLLRGEPRVRVGSDGRVPVREDSYTKLCLPVENIAAARELAAQYGGALQPSDREWTGRNFVACDGHDPEGNVIQVRAPLR